MVDFGAIHATCLVVLVAVGVTVTERLASVLANAMTRILDKYVIANAVKTVSLYRDDHVTQLTEIVLMDAKPDGLEDDAVNNVA